jgi:Domain of unknown function (DUF1844)
MSETEKPFTVSDRRHFTPEGRPRGDAEEAAVPEGSSAAAPTGARVEVPPAAPRAPTAAGPADFSQFVLGLAAQAGILLSGEGLQEGADPREALEGARSFIAILEMLWDKTEGRRTPAETALLEEVLFQLRMSYVGKTRGESA